MAVTCSYLEVYQEQLTDLLRPGVAAGKLAIREDLRAGVFVEGLTEEPTYSGAGRAHLTQGLWVQQHLACWRCGGMQAYAERA